MCIIGTQLQLLRDRLEHAKNVLNEKKAFFPRLDITRFLLGEL